MRLFIKYPGAKHGLRMVIEADGGFYFQYNTLPKQGDKIFEGTLYSWKDSPALKQLPQRMGHDWFMHLFQQLFHYHASRMGENRKKRKKKK